MGSLSRDLKEKQYAGCKAQLDAYVASLKEKGVDDKTAAKDAVYRKLRASVRHARNRILAIDNAKAHVAAMKEKDTRGKTERTAKAAVSAAAPSAKRKKKK